ncbi:MAG TPA: DNA polymerase III subunit gamma/tau C-terminal domain-containing protein, partial [Nevskiaceae bacterium]|nr:DNA polymerase III subunit gamma/tau C-terminal domain-containing protein [Nevskiaceae bacterium]
RIDAMPLEGFVRQLARNCAWLGREGDTVKLALDAKVRHLLQEDRRASLERSLAGQLNSPVKLLIEFSSEAATPARLEQQRVSEQQRAAESAIEADPTVRAFKDTFGASVKAGSVQPTGK